MRAHACATVFDRRDRIHSSIATWFMTFRVRWRPQTMGRRRSSKPPPFRTPALANLAESDICTDAAVPARVTWEHLRTLACAATEQTMRISEGFWRRRPDLNRGWRFCRPLRNVNLAALSCVLVLSRSRFCLVFGRYCSRIALDSPRHQAARSSVARCASKRAQKACSHLLGTRLRRAAMPPARTPFWSS
jgi:hypothetical protein